MNGFVNAQPNITLGSLAMGYLDGSDLPYYWSLANRFTLFDNFFAASQAGPLANRVEAISGQSADITSNAVPAGRDHRRHGLQPARPEETALEVLRAGLHPTASTPATAAGAQRPRNRSMRRCWTCRRSS